MWPGLRWRALWPVPASQPATHACVPASHRRPALADDAAWPSCCCHGQPGLASVRMIEMPLTQIVYLDHEILEWVFSL